MVSPKSVNYKTMDFAKDWLLSHNGVVRTKLAKLHKHDDMCGCSQDSSPSFPSTCGCAPIFLPMLLLLVVLLPAALLSYPRCSSQIKILQINMLNGFLLWAFDAAASAQHPTIPT